MATSSSRIPMPSFVRAIYSHFPLIYNPPIPPPLTTTPSTTPVLWITPPEPSTSKILSTNVECLKWQAYLALRGLTGVRVRWDIDPTGGVDGTLPTLWLPPTDNQEILQGITSSRGEVLSARMIPGWADEVEGEHAWGSPLEGYIDEQAKDESRAWVSLLEGAVHAALLLYQPPPSLLMSWLYSQPSHTAQLATIMTPPPVPLTGLGTLMPPQGINVPAAALQLKYHEAIAALSERLGTDKWFLGSSNPTPLDALLFAYLHIALHPHAKGQERARAEVTHRVNLVAWERKVRSIVQGAFQPMHQET
ncbi:hypothetical protein JB92DRAFT_3040822 [Gautieria morchelliformis]|nr:hypothetical protein JB92DRAFT_3040822 [Gautieria morchelliformis]